MIYPSDMARKKQNTLFTDPVIIEEIICPQCSSIEKANVTDFFPWDEYEHTCLSCGRVIGDKDWNKVESIK